MEKLTNLECDACRADAPRITDVEATSLITQIPDWQIVDIEGIPQLQRAFKFKNFLKAMEFSNKLADLAEEYKHHPAILTEWGNVKVSWWTHKIKGLHKNDFIMAAKTDLIKEKA